MKTNLLTLLALHLGLAAGVAQPVITSQPAWQTNFIGSTATFSVGATGTPPLLYQWSKSAVSLPGQTNSTLVLTNLQLSQQGIYSVVVSNMEGSVTSSNARLYVLTLPAITPANPTASLFADLTLVGTNAPAGPVSYQWLFNGAPIEDAVTNKLVVTNVQKSNAGAYAIVATYAFGSATSQVATLRITPFNSMYCFGFSWTDTHNCPPGSWPASQYYMNRACNGPMWPEFLSTNLGFAYAESNNYARCAATAADVLAQVSTFRAPTTPQLSLYCIWAGDSDFLRAYPPNGAGLGYLSVTNVSAWDQVIESIVLSNSNAVHQLYVKGARTIVIQNLDDFSKEPGGLSAFGADTNALQKLSEYIERCNRRFAEVMASFARTKADIRILFIDVWSKLNEVLANPASIGATKTTIDALSDQLLLDKSFIGPGADYVFWDSGHLTSKLNDYEARWTIEVLKNATTETMEAGTVAQALTLQLNHLLIGRDYTLQTSSDLTSWNDIQTFTASAGTNRWTGPLDGATSAFYRLQWQP